MLSANLPVISHLFSHLESYIPATVITLGAAVLIGCAVSGICSPCKEKDPIFHKQVF